MFDNTKVAVVKTGTNPGKQAILQSIKKAVELSGGFPEKIANSKSVLIKPNICDAVEPFHAEITNPAVAKAVADMLIELGISPVIVESSAQGVITENAMAKTGYVKLRQEGYTVISLDDAEIVTVEIPHGKAIKEVKVFKPVVEAEAVISLPKMKTHYLEPATLAIKNMKGVIPNPEKRAFHLEYGVAQALADLNSVVRPDFSIVEGIIAGEGLGSPFRESIDDMGLIVAGPDPVAVDTITVMIMGLDPLQMNSLRFAEELGVGTMDMQRIEVAGEKIESVRRVFKDAQMATRELVDQMQCKLALNETACTGCRGFLLFALKTLELVGEKEAVRGKTIVAGDAIDEVPSVPASDMILVGKCTRKFKERGLYIPGCPPGSFTIAASIAGKDIEPPWGD